MAQIPMDWNERIAGLPGANLLQTREWAGVKAAGDWDAQALTWNGSGGNLAAAALALRRPLRLGGFAAKLCVFYVPRGPLLDWGDKDLRRRVLDDLQVLARRKGAMFLKIDPEVTLGTGIPGAEGSTESGEGASVQEDLRRRGWVYSPDQIQFRNTAVLDLSGTEEDWLARMKQKTRYNLRLAQRKGVRVRRGGPGDFGLLYRMYAETSVRDGFLIRPETYYRKVWGDFSQRGMCIPLIAESEGVALGAVMLFVYAGRAWYLYGMSRDEQREKMPNYLLQWEAMRAARQAGAAVYDLWGAPESFDESDPLWGVFRFKDGLGAQVVRTLGAWDYPARPIWYSLYTRFLPRVLDVLRRRGKERTRREVAA
jgi:lipid II:glycine glycyltransferase (peptidoglycan interpeptide bridge formation enzyme)